MSCSASAQAPQKPISAEELDQKAAHLKKSKNAFDRSRYKWRKALRQVLALLWQVWVWFWGEKGPKDLNGCPNGSTPTGSSAPRPLSLAWVTDPTPRGDASQPPSAEESPCNMVAEVEFDLIQGHWGYAPNSVSQDQILVRGSKMTPFETLHPPQGRPVRTSMSPRSPLVHHVAFWPNLGQMQKALNCSLQGFDSSCSWVLPSSWSLVHAFCPQVDLEVKNTPFGVGKRQALPKGPRDTSKKSCPPMPIRHAFSSQFGRFKWRKKVPDGDFFFPL